MINASIVAGTVWKNTCIAMQLNSLLNQRIFQSHTTFL